MAKLFLSSAPVASPSKNVQAFDTHLNRGGGVKGEGKKKGKERKKYKLALSCASKTGWGRDE